jgi:hypothetical protein
MNTFRIFREFRACGLEADYIESESIVKSHSHTFDQDIHNALVVAHVESDTDYIAVDLESNVDSLALKTLLFSKFGNDQATSYWNKYLKLQTDMIRQKRQEVYAQRSDPVFLDCIADSGITGDLSSWQSARNEVKNMFPYPGTYR